MFTDRATRGRAVWDDIAQVRDDSQQAVQEWKVSTEQLEGDRQWNSVAH